MEYAKRLGNAMTWKDLAEVVLFHVTLEKGRRWHEESHLVRFLREKWRVLQVGRVMARLGEEVRVVEFKEALLNEDNFITNGSRFGLKYLRPPPGVKVVFEGFGIVNERSVMRLAEISVYSEDDNATDCVQIVFKETDTDEEISIENEKSGICQKRKKKISVTAMNGDGFERRKVPKVFPSESSSSTSKEQRKKIKNDAGHKNGSERPITNGHHRVKKRNGDTFRNDLRLPRVAMKFCPHRCLSPDPDNPEGKKIHHGYVHKPKNTKVRSEVAKKDLDFYANVRTMEDLIPVPEDFVGSRNPFLNYWEIKEEGKKRKRMKKKGKRQLEVEQLGKLSYTPVGCCQKLLSHQTKAGETGSSWKVLAKKLGEKDQVVQYLVEFLALPQG